jgi:23S rRNA (guanosine2251-2'-O)-methyltransferase
MLVYGFHPVREALRHRPREISRVWVAQTRQGRRRHELEELARRRGIRLEVVPVARLDELAPGVHNGFAAEVSGGPEVVPPAADPELIVLVEDVQDPRNLGALLRVCEGAGVGKVLIRDRGSAPVSPTVTRTSAGAAEWLAIERVTNTARAVEELKEAGFWVYGAAAEGQPPWDVDLSGKLMLCFGGEEKGLRRRSREICDGLVGLPMRGRVGSLNLATAAAAVLYEAVRQRELASRGGSG